jgi:N-acetylneuraminate synthase/N,N'-diacetyllegionaminate synthase
MASKKRWPQQVQIGSVAVGGSAPTYIIAEAGVNHNGDLSLALEMVSAAAAVGADAVKFQAFSARRLVTPDASAAGYQRAGKQRELLERLELQEEDFVAIAGQCAAHGIELLITPFSPEDVAMVTSMGVRAIKVASPDLANPPLLKAAARTGLTVVLSTGAADLKEIAAALDTLAQAGAREVALLHCVSSYPTPLHEAQLRCIETLSKKFGTPVGYSDHTMDLQTGELAVQAGACLLEKHFTLDPTLDGPDQAMSLRPVELGTYINRARAARRGELNESALDEPHRQALGDGVKRVRPLEQDVRQAARSSVTSTVAIAKGTVITAAMLTVKRPAGGIGPGELDKVPGRKAAVDIPADATITEKMLK